MKLSELKNLLRTPRLAALERLYGENCDRQAQRYLEAAEAFEALYGDREVMVFSAPGRTEIGGNHTDHNHGRVLAGSVELDVIGIAAKSPSPLVRLKSKGHDENRVELNTLSPREEERETSNALVRGVCARFGELGLPAGGFDAYTTSDVLSGSGLSSSAAFEVLLCAILAGLYGGEVSPIQAAQISQYAENRYFGKPCGLMDQMACSVGGLITIDFENPEAPRVEKVEYDFAKSGHRLCITATGGSHAALSSEYAAITVEMGKVAELLGVTHLRHAGKTRFYAELPRLRGRVSDRALLRAIHFFSDNDRVGAQVEALRSGDFAAFLSLVSESGRSSFMYLQNVFCVTTPEEQNMALALALSDHLLGKKGAFRVHGGGFAGTIQAFVPRAEVASYQAGMDAVFGPGSCKVLTIRPQGGVRVF